MEIVNRGYLILGFRQDYCEWAKKFDEEMDLQESELEPSIYLIEEEFMEDDQLIESHFKKIMETELLAVTEDEEQWPEINRVNFDAFFTYFCGTSVFDSIPKSIQKETI